MEKKGWIALDIDGTITLDKYSVPAKVIETLSGFHAQGWEIALITGRPFTFAQLALSNFHFPYLFIAQNGSLALEMPEKKVLFKSYLSKNLIPKIEAIFEPLESDFLIYSGYEKGDFCYWRPQKIPPEDIAYLKKMQNRQKEKWVQVDRFDTIQQDQFPLVKCYGKEKQASVLEKALKNLTLFQVAKIRDPFASGYYLLLVTDQQASKGNALKKILDSKGRGKKVVAAGDDENDLSLLEAADIKIAMHHAPKSLQKVAHFIAPPTKDYGIIHALHLALKNNTDH